MLTPRSYDGNTLCRSYAAQIDLLLVLTLVPALGMHLVSLNIATMHVLLLDNGWGVRDLDTVPHYYVYGLNI